MTQKKQFIPFCAHCLAATFLSLHKLYVNECSKFTLNTSEWYGTVQYTQIKKILHTTGTYDTLPILIWYVHSAPILAETIVLVLFSMNT